MSKIPQSKEKQKSLLELVKNVEVNIDDVKATLGQFSEKEKLNVEELFIIVYFIVNNFLNCIGGQKQLRRSNNNNPKFTDDEIITLNIVKELCQQDSQNAWHRYIRKNYLYLFPEFICRPQYVKRTFRLHEIICFFQQHLCNLVGANTGKYYLVDSFPISLCNLQRLKSSSQPFEYYGANFGHCASKKSNYYGYKCHLVSDLRGIPIFACLTGANMSDVKAFEFVVQQMLEHRVIKTHSLCISDKGYVGKEFQKFIQKQYGVELLSMQREYNNRGSALNQLLQKARKIIETTINLLVNEFSLSATKRRSIKGLANSISNKIAAFNLANFLNYLSDLPVLQVKGFVF
ncbi:IS982 family transposase [Candidatus Uabimicrobium sp. HlEnr_7]|uniref:IS982 family transposase n=1 Tax=Candidatus Uabimicrobium helgolandensis TaxID=3095367 RepID=UPI003558BB0E